MSSAVIAPANLLISLKHIPRFKHRYRDAYTHIRRSFADMTSYYDLLRAETFLKLSMRPQALREELEEVVSRRTLKGPVIIDEIQKLPLLLDEVHSMREDLRLQFILTGSSARKIKRRGSNLLGVRNTLASVRQVDPGTDAWGKAMEHFEYIELRSWLAYRSDVRDLSFWRTRDNREVDFIIGDDTAIEVKASSNSTDRHVKNLLELKKEVEILPLKVFLQRLWEGEYS